MSKKTSGTVRLLLKGVFGLLLSGAIGFLLLVGVYLALAKDPAEAAASQAVAARGGVAATHVTQEEAGREPTQDAQPIPAGPGPTERLVPVQEYSTRDERDPKTGEVRRVPVLTTRYVPFTPAPTAADRRAEELAAKIRGTEDDAERAKLRESLLKSLDAAFDERRERQSEAIDQLEKQIDELRALYEQRGERKDEIVQRRLSELLAEPDVLAWDPASGIVGAPGKYPRTVERDDRVPSGSTSLPGVPSPIARLGGELPSAPSGSTSLPGVPRAYPSVERDDRVPSGATSVPGVPGEPRVVEREQVAPPKLGEAAKDDRFGPSTRRSAAKDDGISPSDVPGGAPFAGSGPFPGSDPFSGPPQRPRTGTEARAETAAPSADSETTAAAEAASSAKGEAIRFDGAERILELLAEIARLEAEGAPDAERRLQLARAKLEIAELGWAQTEQRIRGRIDATDAQRKRAEDHLKQLLDLYKEGATPRSQVLDAEADLEQVQAERRAAMNLLEAWHRTDAVVQKYSASIEAGAEQPDDATANSETIEREPATTDEEEAVLPQDVETGEP